MIKCIWQTDRHMTSWHGDTFRITDPLWKETTGPRWIPSQRVSNEELWYFLWWNHYHPKQTVDKILLPAILDALALMWNDCDGRYHSPDVRIIMHRPMHYFVLLFGNSWLYPYHSGQFYDYLSISEIHLSNIGKSIKWLYQNVQCYQGRIPCKHNTTADISYGICCTLFEMGRSEF